MGSPLYNVIPFNVCVKQLPIFPLDLQFNCLFKEFLTLSFQNCPTQTLRVLITWFRNKPHFIKICHLPIRHYHFHIYQGSVSYFSFSIKVIVNDCLPVEFSSIFVSHVTVDICRIKRTCSIKIKLIDTSLCHPSLKITVTCPLIFSCKKELNVILCVQTRETFCINLFKDSPAIGKQQ